MHGSSLLHWDFLLATIQTKLNLLRWQDNPRQPLNSVFCSSKHFESVETCNAPGCRSNSSVPSMPSPELNQWNGVTCPPSASSIDQTHARLWHEFWICLDSIVSVPHSADDCDRHVHECNCQSPSTPTPPQPPGYDKHYLPKAHPSRYPHRGVALTLESHALRHL